VENFNLDTDEQKEWYKIRTDQSSEHLGDCLELMPLIADKSIDMILCDLPYGTTHESLIRSTSVALAGNVIGLGEGGLVGCSNLAECFCQLLPNPCYMKCRLI